MVRVKIDMWKVLVCLTKSLTNHGGRGKIINSYGETGPITRAAVWYGGGHMR